MKEILLTQDKVALVDDADYNELSKYKWHAWKNQQGAFYAVRNFWQKGKKMSYRVYMHRAILELKKGDKRQVDHISHITLNNCRNNLRICTRRQNMMNQKSHPNSTSQFKGVIWDRFRNKWKAQISINGKTKYLGYYIIEKEAALAYNMAAIKYYGEFACLNFS